MDNIKHGITTKEIKPLIKFDESLKIIKNHKYAETDIKYLNQYIKFDKLTKYKTIIIKSCCGTGKSTTISQYLEHENNKAPVNFLSIVDRIALSVQHVKTFENNNVINYINKKKYLSSEDLLKKPKKIICVNSLLKIVNMPMEEINNTIIYIDEIDSFLKSICSTTIKNKKLQIIRFLFKLIENCKQLILSDAELKNNINYIIEKREGAIYYINNKYKTFENIKANILNDENIFIDQLINNINNNNYFLCSFDSRKAMDRVFEAVKEKIKDTDKLLLKKYSSKCPIDFTDASVELKNKYIFHSPTIGTGVDFKINTPQDVYIHIGGKSLDPCGLFQMISRTRNIKQVYIFGNNKSIDKKNITLKDVKKKYLYINNEYSEDEKIFYNATDYYNLFCYNTYIDNLYSTNKFKYFIDILNNQGFKIIDNNNKIINLSKDKIKELDEVIHKNNIDEYNKGLILLEKYKFNINDIEDPSTILNNISFLKLCDRSEYLKIEEVRELIIDNNEEIDKYINLIKFCYTDDKITQKLNEYGNDNFLFLKPYSLYNKINLLRELEKAFKINIFDKDINNNNKTEIDINTDFFYKIADAFELSKVKPTTHNNIIELYIKMLKKLIPINNFIETERIYKRDEGKKQSYIIYKISEQFKKLLGIYINLYVNDNIILEYNINKNILNYVMYETNETDFILRLL